MATTADMRFPRNGLDDLLPVNPLLRKDTDDVYIFLC
jgi:hypothetical protein